MIRDEIIARLTALKDESYGDFQSKLIPTIDRSAFIGVRTPDLRALAKELSRCGDIGGFLDTLPHRFFDENQLHAFLISLIKDYDLCIERTNTFLPYIDNWATCDQLSPKVFKKHRQQLLSEIDGWLRSGRTYTVRFGIGMLMQHFLDDDYSPEYPMTVSRLRSDEYYVNMMIAWYFATALAKQYDTVLPLMERRVLDPWTHNKAIQKAVESRRVAPEQKEALKALKLRA